MNTDDLTLGQIKEIKYLIGGCETKTNTSSGIYSRYVGKYVICRSRNEGVNAGKVIEIDDTGVILEDARRLYYHKPINKNVSWYEGVAQSGVDSSSKIGAAVEKVISEDYSLTIVSDVAEKSIREAKNYDQS